MFLARAAVYIINHLTSGIFYIGSTSDLYVRMRNHKSQLTLGRHHSKKLQEQSTKWDDFEIRYVYLDEVEDVVELEQALLHANLRDPLCANRTVNASFPFKDRDVAILSRRNSTLSTIGVPRTIDVKRKISLSKSKQIEINGVIYSTANEAASALNISAQCLRQRIRSKSPKYKRYFYR